MDIQVQETTAGHGGRLIAINSPMPSLRPTYSYPEPGVFIIRYDAQEQILPENLTEALDELIKVAHHRKVIVIADIQCDISRVPMEVPVFWLKLVKRTDIQIRGIVCVTRSMAVQLAARGFDAARRAIGHPIQIATFPDRAKAVEWAKRTLSESVESVAHL